MGFLKKLANKAFKIYTGQEFLERAGVLGDGDQPPGVDYESGDPYTTNVQWDETGRPVGRMPRGKYALDYQYEADRRTQDRRNALWSDAHGALRQGQGMLESYRPGGAAALASGIYGQRAAMYGQQSMTLQSPDLLMGYREHKQDVADYERKKAVEDAQFMNLLGAGINLLGMGGLGGGGAAGAQDASGGGSYVNNQGGITPSQPGGNNFAPLGTQRGGQTMYGPGWGNTPQQGGGAFQARLQGSQGQQGGAVGGQGGQQMQGGQGPQMGGGAPQGSMPGSGGGAPMVGFTSDEAASQAMAQMPMMQGVYRRWLEDEDRQETTFFMQQSAASRVMAAMRA